MLHRTVWDAPSASSKKNEVEVKKRRESITRRQASNMSMMCLSIKVQLKADSLTDSFESLKELLKSQPRSQSSSAISDVTSPVKLVGKVRYRARFQASSGHSDSANRPGYEAAKKLVIALRFTKRPQPPLRGPKSSFVSITTVGA